MQVFVILAFALIGFTLNFFWDRTVRRRQAALMAASRREARPRALPPAPDEHEQERRVPDPKLRFFIDLTRQTFTELDQLINHFDLLVLRSQDRARIGVVTIRSESPRAQARTLLERWLDAWVDVDDDTREHLQAIALGPEPVAAVLEREHERNLWEFRRDSAEVLVETITDLDRAVIQMQGVVRALETTDDDPYR
ncbi:MAG TPA: hypothetical protein VM869_00725 [Enhygromyxa sp.]|nr:hypothetical protein [Enhygromyxa sp.]